MPPGHPIIFLKSNSTNKAALSIKRSIGEGGSPDHGSFPFADYEYLWPRVSCVKAGGFPGQLFLHWHSRLLLPSCYLPGKADALFMANGKEILISL